MSKNKYISELYSFYEDKMQNYIVTEEFSKLSREIINKTDKLNKDLTDDQKDLLNEILELKHHKGALEDEQVFTYAFSLAIKLIFCGLIKDDDDFESICKNV